MLAISVLASIHCAACGANSLTGAASSADPISASSASVEILAAAPASGSRLGEVIGISCRNKAWDPEPTQENALAILKSRAATLGGNALVDVRYEKGIFNPLENCWHSIKAYGTAYKRAG